MRRIFSAVLAGAAALAFSASEGGAQTIGFKLGASFANLSVDEPGTTNVSGITGFAGGGFVRFGAGPIGIQAELLSVTKGAEFSDVDGTDDGDLRLEYIEVPVLLHLPLNLGVGLSPYVFGGPAFSFEVGCEFSDAAGSFDCDNQEADVFTRKTTDIGITAGGGLAFAMGPGALLVEGRYTWGTTNINETPNGPEVKNRAALVTAGYAIPLNRGF